ncbi:MAG: hypothetical protein SFV21_10365 [Rhodospirillaceae bacterium]|nr:hypothetical protein [Rhodospirillaceae bacterium]
MVAKKKKRQSTRTSKPVVLVATRKGAWILRGDANRRTWTLDGPHFLGQIVNHLVLDPRDRRTLLAATSTGHLGPTIHHSTDLGRTWTEVPQPPAFAKAADPAQGRSVNHTFWLTPAHANEPNVWYAGTSPQGLFRSDDGGLTWTPFSTLNDDPQFRKWMGTVQDGTPDGPKLHSVTIDPRDPKHMYIAMSGGGVHETLDGGQTWSLLIDGLAVVEGFNFDKNDPTFHDPHCMRMCPTNPDRLYQQNHCGIYRLDRPSRTWERIGRAMPKTVGDIGLPLALHPRDDRIAYVFPMDGSGVWPRTALAGKPAAYVTRNAGKSWQRLDAGLPGKQAWWTIKRQAFASDRFDPVGLYVGNTGGELWMMRDDGSRRWTCLARHLPEIYAVEAADAA